jgi:hypothetical protein
MKFTRREQGKPVVDDTGELEKLDLSLAEGVRYLLLNGIPLSHVRSSMRIAWRAVQLSVCVIVIANAAGSESIPQVFARDRDVKAGLQALTGLVYDLRKDFKDERLERLDVEIFKLQANYCKETDQTVKEFTRQRINELAKKYEATKGQWPRIPDCD